MGAGWTLRVGVRRPREGRMVSQTAHDLPERLEARRAHDARSRQASGRTKTASRVIVGTIVSGVFLGASELWPQTRRRHACPSSRGAEPKDATLGSSTDALGSSYQGRLGSLSRDGGCTTGQHHTPRERDFDRGPERRAQSIAPIGVQTQTSKRRGLLLGLAPRRECLRHDTSQP
jgi:hypothetical protein